MHSESKTWKKRPQANNVKIYISNELHSYTLSISK